MEVKLNDRFTLTTDAHNWIVVETYLGKAKKGREPRFQKKETFFSRPESALGDIINRSVMICDKAEALLEAIETAKKEITEAVMSMPLGTHKLGPKKKVPKDV